MNKEYFYINEKLIIEDEKLVKKVVEYSDNFEEILIQENLIETMEKKSQELEKKLNANKENNKPYIPYIVPAALFAILIAKPVMGTVFGIDTTMMIDTIFGTMNFLTPILGLTAVLVLPLTIVMEILSYSQYRINKKSRRSDVAEYEYLQKELEIQKVKLEELKKDKTKDNEFNEEFKVGKVDDLEVLNKLRNWLILYSNLGYNTEKYYRLHQKGKLEEKLKRDGYTEFACECAKEFIEEKGPVLTRKLTLPKYTHNK